MSLLAEMNQKALKLGVPISVHFDITYRCNERCVHCYLDHDDHGEQERREGGQVAPAAHLLDHPPIDRREEDRERDAPHDCAGERKQDPAERDRDDHQEDEEGAALQAWGVHKTILTPPGSLTSCGRPPPDRGQHLRPGGAGSVVFLEWVGARLVSGARGGGLRGTGWRGGARRRWGLS